ncbi:MAG: helix-turn-helix transcriptional regulator [Clostridia bacterium]|nr:helix-turn-helix transcriptional regulator [Clostridia bacterium]
MKGIKVDKISATFHHGERVILTDFWQDKDVICPDSKLFYITDGEIVIRTEKEEILAESGDMILIPAGTKHDFHLSKKNYASKYWLHVDVTVNGNNLFDYFSLPYKIHIGKNDYVEGLFQTVLKLSESKSLSDKLNCSAALCSLLSFYADHCTYFDSRVREDEIDKSVNYIKSHYNEKFTLEDLCRTANLSKGYFLRRFKERTGHSPMHYLNVLKIDKAKTLLEQSNRPINEIMEELGYFDSAHFSKLFKTYCGYSPKKFREINGYRAANKSVK